VFVTGSTLSPGLTPVRLTWAGHDSGTGIDHFQLARSTDGGSWTAPTTVAGTSVVQGLRGHEYRFHVRAIDGAGNVGRWMPGPIVQVRRVGEARSTVHYRGGWLRSTGERWLGGTAKHSSTPGATVSFTFTGRSIAWVGLTAPNRGRARIFVNGTRVATVDLSSATTQAQRVVWSASFARSATRTVTIKVVGTAHRPRVDVDGFLVGR
jgi:hypothetical protein